MSYTACIRVSLAVKVPLGKITSNLKAICDIAIVFVRLLPNLSEEHKIYILVFKYIGCVNTILINYLTRVRSYR